MNKRMFNLAKQLSQHSTHPEHKHAAILTDKRGRPIGTGFNKSKTNPSSQHPHKSIHAEFSAILNSNRQDFTGCELYVVRVRKNGKFANSRPCTHCLKMITDLGIEKIHYSTDVYFNSEKVA